MKNFKINTQNTMTTLVTQSFPTNKSVNITLLPEANLRENMLTGASRPEFFEDLVKELDLEQSLDSYPENTDALTRKKAELAIAVMSDHGGTVSFNADRELSPKEKTAYFNYLHDVCYGYGLEGFTNQAASY